ncbi:hypothetical protein [Clostridium sporogenes]|uniref:hypothetical protein n=1 Tax=Clostridium sporogenes TaxID=1509 RepID=UPI0013D76344|nr:hypothetical protein [Clostridium sporogenes]NFF75978.1 hypothetical protein [Clostridium sporogenes]NFH40875.1 hypothetical protein [Clostridium sporogenes]
MNLDEYLDKILENVMSTGGIEKVKNIIKEDMNLCGFKYETTKVVEGQVYTEENNYAPRVEISSENYPDGEVIFIDYHVDDI